MLVQILTYGIIGLFLGLFCVVSVIAGTASQGSRQVVPRRRLPELVRAELPVARVVTPGGRRRAR